MSGGGGGLRGELEIESTYAEIVDVRLTPSAGLAGPDHAALNACMSAFAWALLLPGDDFVDERRSWAIELRA